MQVRYLLFRQVSLSALDFALTTRLQPFANLYGVLSSYYRTSYRSAGALTTSIRLKPVLLIRIWITHLRFYYPVPWLLARGHTCV